MQPAYLKDLNPEQRHAVETIEGPVLVLAGAGVGKTRVLTVRIAHILNLQRARGHEILAVTFTNKAAQEMRERVAALVGLGDGLPWMGTFHAIGVKFLRRHAELLGLKSNFTILDTDDQLRLLKQILRAENIDEKRWPARMLAGLIDRWKNRGLSPKDVSQGQGESSDFAQGVGPRLYSHYQERLKALNSVDFGDLLLESLRLLRENDDILALYQERFRYILVDEYQDTNIVQYLWLRLLAQKRRNVCCVGDDDQAIYSWRGADVANILGFERDFADATVIRLEQNYRSSGHILGLASGLIAHNTRRLGKTLFTRDIEGERPEVRGVHDSAEEARDIAAQIESAQAKGTSLNAIAILVRASFQMREFEERFLTIGLPYRVIGGPRFYERLEIRDALAYLRVIAQADDDLAFERICNTPKRGLGETTLAQLHKAARVTGTSLTQAALRITQTDELKPRARSALRALLNDFARWRSFSGSCEDLARIVIEESGLSDMWQTEKTPEAEGRLENLKEFVRSMGDFPSLEAFLEHVSLVMEAETQGEGPKVTLMTLHAAKGLEFDVVFLPGWEEGLFPHPRVLDESGRAGLEEERRLAYVGITRAKRKVMIYYAANRRVRGFWQSWPPSRFIDELPAAHVQTDIHPTPMHPLASRFDLAATSRDTPGWKRAQAQGAVVLEGRTHIVNKPAAYRVGDRVAHAKFGAGLVVAESHGKLTIDFDVGGQKTVLDSFVSPIA